MKKIKKISAKPLSWYTFETPRVYVFWNNKQQPMGPYRTALEAIEAVKRMNSSPNPADHWQLKACTDVGPEMLEINKYL